MVFCAIDFYMGLELIHSSLLQAQTPQQRKANERYARQEAAKRGKPESVVKKKQKFNPPISSLWIGMLMQSKGRI